MKELADHDPLTPADPDQRLRARIAAATAALVAELGRPMWVPRMPAPQPSAGPDPLLGEVIQVLAEVQARGPDRFEEALHPMLDTLGRLQRKTEQELGVICEWLERSSHPDPATAATLPPRRTD